MYNHQGNGKNHMDADKKSSPERRSIVEWKGKCQYSLMNIKIKGRIAVSKDVGVAADNVSFFRHLNIGLRPSRRALIRP